MDTDSVTIEIEWPELKVSIGMLEITYQLEDVLGISGDTDVSILEITEYGLVVEYGENETEFIDMRPLTATDEVMG